MKLPAVRRVVRIDEFGTPGVLHEVTEPMPPLTDEDVVIRVVAAGVNFADTMVRRGVYRRSQQLPHVPGAEVAGTVVYAPPRSGLKPGLHVAGFLEQGGGYTDYAVVPASCVFEVPDDIDLVDVAACFLQGVTAWYAVDRFGRVGPGKTVLITAAAGGLGGLAVQLAADLGATVVGTASTADKRTYAEGLGCQFTFDLADPDLATRITDVTGGKGADTVIDSVGGETFSPLLACLAHNGTFVVVGSSTQAPAMLDIRHLIPRGQTVCGVLVRRVADADPEEPGRALQHVLSRLKAGALRHPQQRLPLDQASHAHDLLESRRSMGKLVLIP